MDQNINPFSVVKNKYEVQNSMNNYVIEEDALLQQKSKKKSKRQLLKIKKIKERKANSLPTKHPDAEERTIFVGNININTRRRKVERYFSKYGEIESVRYRGIAPENINMTKKEAITKRRIHPDRTSLISYIRFKDKSSKEKALEANGEIFEGYHIRVDNAIPSKHKEKNVVFVGNLPWEVKEEDLWALFGGCGNILNVRIVRSSITGAGKGIAFISLQSIDAVEMALQFNGKNFNDRVLRVSKAVKKFKEKHAERMPRKQSALVKILSQDRNKSYSMKVNFLKKDKPRHMEKKTLKKKQRKGQEFPLAKLSGDFAGVKVIEDGKAIKKIKKKGKTKTEKKKFNIAKQLCKSI